MRGISVLTKEPQKGEYSWWRENAFLSGSLECDMEEEAAAEENRGSQATPHYKLVMPHFVGPMTKKWGSASMCIMLPTSSIILNRQDQEIRGWKYR